MWKRRLSLFLLLSVSSLSLAGCSIFKSGPTEGYRVKLEVWGTFDDSDAYEKLFGAFKKIDPYVTDITYRKLPVETYKADLLNALAAGNGPDIFMVRNSWVSSFGDKVAPAPDNLVGVKEFRDAFADVVQRDFIGQDGKIEGAALSADSLALYYNKDIFNAAGITTPPTTWEELLADARLLNRIDQFGNVRQSAIALGTAYNINRSTDILTALMLQYGSGISQPENRSKGRFSDEAGVKALDFYTQFSHIGSAQYSWNPSLHYSIDAFYEGTLAMMINYSWQYPVIKQKNAKLNFGIVPLPQFAGAKPINFANYWGYAVSKNKLADLTPDSSGAQPVSTDPAKQNFLRVHEAWQLLKFLTFPHPNDIVTLMNGLAGTTKDFKIGLDPAETYLKDTLKPAARRDLIEKQKTDVVLSAFATGNLIDYNWFQGNTEAMEAVLADTIDAVSKGEKSSKDALGTAANRIDTLGR